MGQPSFFQKLSFPAPKEEKNYSFTVGNSFLPPIFAALNESVVGSPFAMTNNYRLKTPD